ncbi:hypothetical protein L0152_31225, partial [bacterium]|nr:hypothetical protein [bacterium]
MRPVGGPISPEAETSPEQFYKNYIPTIRYYLEWFQNCWRPFEESLIAHGMRWNEYLEEQRIKQPQNSLVRLIGPISSDLSDILTAKYYSIRFEQLQEWFASLREKIQPYLRSRVANKIHESIQSLNPVEYQSALNRLKHLHSIRALFELRQSVIQQLATICPKWALAIQQRTEPHHQATPPGDIEVAWEWRQLEHELKRRSSININELQNNRDKKILELQRITGRMIEKKSWAAQLRRNSLELQQSLMGWLQTVKSIGRGYGKMSTHYRQLASQQMRKCREAVPVWIMPMAKMVEQFFPLHKKFDVVIIDEASQSDVMALLALYVGKKVIVVGDDEQVSPLAVGQDLEYVNGIIEQYLENIPNRHLYTGRTSIYDLAKMSFPATTCLLEHFRCVPEIIGFSNALSYDHRIRPLREAGDVESLPHTISYRVRASYKDGKVNRQEAIIVASLLIAATEQSEYLRKTFGVISLVGEEQAIEIA